MYKIRFLDAHMLTIILKAKTAPNVTFVFAIIKRDYGQISTLHYDIILNNNQLRIEKT